MLYYKKTMLTALSLLIAGSNSVSSAGDREVSENYCEELKGQTLKQANKPSNQSPERDQSPVRSSISKPQNAALTNTRAASERSDTKDEPSKKIRLSPADTPEEVLPIGVEDSPLLPQLLDWLLQTPQVGDAWSQVKERIIGHMPPEAQQNLALVCRANLEAVLKYRMYTDPRTLQNKPWVEGLPVGSTELYRFNAAVFHALTYAIKLRSEMQDRPVPPEHISKTTPIYYAYTFLLETFHHTYPNVTNRVNDFLRSLIVYFTTTPSVQITLFPSLSTCTIDPNNQSEIELAEVMAFFSDRDYTPRQVLRKADDEEKNEYLTPLERYYWARRWRREAGIASWSGDYKHSQEIYEKILKRTGVNATLDDYRSAAYENLRAHNFDRATDLLEEVLKKAGVNAMLDDYRYAASANYRTGNLDRTTELLEEVLKKAGVNAMLFDYRSAARVNDTAGNFDRATELYEEVLKKAGVNAMLDDYRNAADGNSRAHNFDRATELYEEILKKAGVNAMLVDYRFAARANYTTGNFDRANELYEEILKKSGVNAMLDDYKFAARANYTTGNFDRATELYEEILKKAGVNTMLNDYKNAAAANFRAHNFGRATEIRLESRKHYTTVMEHTEQIILFSCLHCDPHKYAKEIADTLKNDLLTDTEKGTYISIFQNFSENREATVQAIDEFLSAPDNDDPNSSILSKIIYRVGYMLHTIGGNTAKADELKTKLGW